MIWGVYGVKWGLSAKWTISGADIMRKNVANATVYPGGRDASRGGGTCKTGAAAVSTQGGDKGAPPGRAWLLPAECSGYSLRACSLHPVAPGGDIHLGPDRRHQENA